LAAWRDRALPLQPCLCDIWHDHVLFEGDTVSGIIDYGSVKPDHISVDLARLLGSMAGEDMRLRSHGLEAYSRNRTLSPDEEALVTVLDRTGTLVGMCNWLLWLYRGGKPVDNMEAATARLATLVRRAEQWQPPC
jgi:Ser/Thr protein kinase RdoA (MazF antagonist)